MRLSPAVLCAFVALASLISVPSIAQTLVNGDLMGDAAAASQQPDGWEPIPYTDPISEASWEPGTTSDVTNETGPSISGGIIGTAHSGTTFVSGLHTYSDYFDETYMEGIMQTVDGFNVGQTYTITLFQSVVKQSNKLDESGSWALFVDETLAGVTAPTFSDAPYNELDLNWEARTLTFVATNTTHALKFMPWDDDDNIDDIQGIRMGIDTIELISCTPPALALGEDVLSCADAFTPFSLNVFTEGATYLWQDGSSDSTFTVTEAGEYWVELAIDDCTSVDTLQVVLNPPPSVTLPPDTMLCPQDLLVLDLLDPSGTVTWQDGSSTSTYTVDEPGMYAVNIEVEGCPAASDSVAVSYAEVPEVTLGNDTTLCAGSLLVLEAPNGADQYEWQDGADAMDYTVSESGAYWVSAAFGECVSEDSISVFFNPTPEVALGNDLVMCEGESWELDPGTVGDQYLWQDGTSSPTYWVNLPGVYWVQVTTDNCTGTDSVVVDLTPLPTVDLPTQLDLCDGDVYLADATVPGGSYLWQDGSTTPGLNITDAGTYWVEVTVDGCTASDSMLVALAELAPPELGNDTTLCEGTTLVLDATQFGVNYLWQNGDTTATHTVTGMGTYWVQVEVTGCAPLSDSIEVLVQPLPAVDLGADLNVCEGDTVLLDVGTNGGTYLWQDNSTSATYWVTGPGNYAVEVTALGCSASDALSVDYHPLPELDLGPDLDLCEGETWTLTAGDAEQSYLWHTGADQPSHEVTAPGLVWVVANNDYCSASDSLQVIYTALPLFGWAAEVELCIDQTVALDPQLDVAATVVWEDGATDPVLIVDEPGFYSAAATFNNCTSEDQVWVTEILCETELEFPNVFTPGEDASNDVFVPITALGVEEITFEVFNRWGNLVYRSQGDQVAWDGRNLNGDAVASGTYYWVAEYIGFTGETFTASGMLTLLRE